MNLLLLEKAGDGLYVIKLNRPKQLNALSSQLLGELDRLLDDLQKEDLKGLIITGEGSRAFAAGADIAEMKDMTREQAKDYSLMGNRVFRKIEQLPVPVIAAVNGYALGGGCELALSCDLILCDSRAVFAQPETGLGICPGFGGTIRLARRIGMQAAKEMIFSGRQVKADEAVRIGLALRQYADEDLLPAAAQLLQIIARNSSFAVSAAKRSMDRGWNMDIGNAADLEAECFSECFLHADQRERMESFLSGERRSEKKKQ